MTAARTVLVTGAAGAIGRRMLQNLRAHGWRTRCLIHRHDAAGADESVHGDVMNPGTLAAATLGADAVVHLAAVTHSRSAARYDAVNVVGTRNLLAASAAAGVRRFLFVSTRAISPVGGAYSLSKHRAEQDVQGGPVPWTIVRLPEVYGAGRAEGVDRILVQAREGGRIAVVGRGDDVLCPAHVDDVVEACVAALDAPAAVGHTYTLAGEPLTMRQFAEMAADAFGRSPRVLSVPATLIAVLAALSRVLPLPLYPDQLARLRAPKPLASAEAERDLGFRPRSLRQGLATLS